MRRARTTDTVVPFRNSLARRDAEEQSPDRIDVVIFEIDALQPWMIPAQFFLLHKRFKQPFFGDPIDSADQRFMISLKCFKNEAPVFQQPVGFRAAVTQILSRQLVEFPLHIERADSLAILVMDNPLVSGIARDVAWAPHASGKHKTPRQTAIREQR